KTEVDALLGPVDRPLVQRLVELIHAIEGGRRACEPGNLRILEAYRRAARAEPGLNAIITEIGAPDRAAEGALTGTTFGIKDNIDVAGAPTTNASSVGRREIVDVDAEVVRRLRSA